MSSIVHLTSAHPRYDTRIFVKQCRSLAAHGHAVTLIVADGRGGEKVGAVRIVDVGRLPGRLNRVLRSTRRVFEAAADTPADVYQLHDPELIPAGLRLKQMGRRVVFDSHEDVPSQLLGKPYLHPAARQLASTCFGAYERHACRQFDGIIGATPFIRDKFLGINAHTVDINNYPLTEEFDASANWQHKPAQVCYVGGITAMRGIRELVAACARLNSSARLQLAGQFSEPALQAEMQAQPGWKKVDALGHLDRDGVGQVMAQAMAGLVTLHPVVNYLDALPVKMFEYMAAGIPVIASSVPLWRAIIERHDCGICVDPFDPAAIAQAIDFLVLNPQAARRLGENGRRAVLEHYNWQAEARKLIAFYAHL